VGPHKDVNTAEIIKKKRQKTAKQGELSHKG
jgi:hypothetical protein